MTPPFPIHRLPVVVILLAGVAGAALAQTPAEFPAGASTPNAAQIQQHLEGKVFNVKLANGLSWRLEYNTRGNVFVDVSNGFRGKGDWTAEDGKVCSQMAGNNRTCNEVRLHEGVMQLRRDSGEIIQLMPK